MFTLKWNCYYFLSQCFNYSRHNFVTKFLTSFCNIILLTNFTSTVLVYSNHYENYYYHYHNYNGYYYHLHQNLSITTCGVIDQFSGPYFTVRLAQKGGFVCQKRHIKYLRKSVFLVRTVSYRTSFFQRSDL